MSATSALPNLSPSPSNPLSQELLLRILTYLSPRRRDLISLLQVSQAFSTLTLPLLYTHPVLPTSTHAHLFLRTILHHPERQGLVKTLSLQASRGPLRWDTLREALKGMKALETLLLVYTGEGSGGWVLEPPEEGWPFQLKELKARIGYDPALVSFLCSQPSLQFIQMYPITLPPISLPPSVPMPSLNSLTAFDGMISLLPLLVSHPNPPPITGMQLILDMPPEKGLVALRSLAKVGKTMRGLSLQDVPDECIGDFLAIISRSCPYLRHLGVIPISRKSGNRTHIHDRLFPLSYLTTIELDLTKLFAPHSYPSSSPVYNPQAPQALMPILRSLAAELKTIRPSLKVIVMWIYGTRWKWFFEKTDSRMRVVAGGACARDRDKDKEIGVEDGKVCPGAGMDMEWKHVMENFGVRSGAQVGWTGWWNHWT